jgi:Tfp pilus assembly protein PilF
MTASANAARITVEQVDSAVAAHDMDRAVALAETALRQGLEHPSVLNLVAYQRELQGDLADALVLLERALRLDPSDPYVLNSIGVCWSKSSQPAEALDAFDRAIALEPGFAHAHNGRGLALAAIGDRSAARLAQLRAAELDPAFPEPLGALAALAAEDEDWANARALADRALALDPQQPAAALAMAAAELEAGDAAAAEARAMRLIDGGRLTQLHLASAEHMRAQALEKLGRHREAMRSYMVANREARAIQVPGLQAKELGVETAQRLIDYFETASPEDWLPIAEPAAHGAEAGHAFLVGFARSGTTLLEQILASHPQMVALEEKPTLDDAIKTFFADDAGLDRLARLSEAEADLWRRRYWDNVRAFGVEPAGKVFVDKLPLHTLYLPLIAKLFPRARILLARRDPRDVVVSCFRKRFRPNPLVVEFTDLERTARIYASTMRLAEIYGETLALPVHVHRHEGLIEDLDGSTRAICDFLGMPWDPQMRDFVETANRRDIRTPSAGQVRRGLNRDGVEQWRKYGDTIDAIHPWLDPWVTRFGYSGR